MCQKERHADPILSGRCVNEKEHENAIRLLRLKGKGDLRRCHHEGHSVEKSVR